MSSNHSNSMECAKAVCTRFLTSGRSTSVREGVGEGRERGETCWRERASISWFAMRICLYHTSASEVMLSCTNCSSDRAGRSQHCEWAGSVVIATPTSPTNRKWAGLSGGLSVALQSSLVTCVRRTSADSLNRHTYSFQNIQSREIRVYMYIYTL